MEEGARKKQRPTQRNLGTNVTPREKEERERREYLRLQKKFNGSVNADKSVDEIVRRYTKEFIMASEQEARDYLAEVAKKFSRHVGRM